MTTHYRFTTPHRAGKWYPDIRTAQEQAYAIGAGFLDARSGAFYQYPGTRLETQIHRPQVTAACHNELAA